MAGLQHSVFDSSPGRWLLDQLKALRPSFLSKTPHFRFITAHYFLIIGVSVLGSVIIYGAGKENLAYIDALFFATGANTQAGLNTIDVSNLNTFQQACLYVLPMLTNPITINSFVVYLRLYWFEKRFQHVVTEARQRRATLSKSRTVEPKDPENGVNGRNITVVFNGQQSRMTHDGIVPNQSPTANNPCISNMTGDSGHPGDGSSASMETPEPPRQAETMFPSTEKRGHGLEESAKIPQAVSSAEHISILERQRKTDDEILRIPGPRDAERGMLPKRVEESDDKEPEPVSRNRRRRTSSGGSEMERPEPAAQRALAITIAEPNRPNRDDLRRIEELIDDARAANGVLACSKPRKNHGRGEKGGAADRDDVSIHPTRLKRRSPLGTIHEAFKDKEMGTPYLSWNPTLGRNSAFHDLNEEQREELGGIEYRSLKTLALVLFVYFWGFQILGATVLVPWILRTNTYGRIVDNVSQNRVWWGFFTANSAFLDLGFTLTADSMNSFNTAVVPLLLMSFLIVAGNTGFPVLLRFMIWIFSQLVPRGSGLWEELRFLLDHPRRCFTLLFPSAATWWLFWLLVILNGVDLVFFIVLDLGSGPIDALPGGIKVLDGLFQAASTRTAGFSCVNLANLHPGVQVSYMIMMYISVFPIAISVRRTNVYEEKSLGVYSSHHEDMETTHSDLSYVGAHLRRQLSFDLWYIFVGFFILSISEGSRLIRNDFSMFAVLFEVVSAYGTVGMSLGYPTVSASLCSQFSVVGKLVIICMMIRGRHRGLPYGLDRAILLPSESRDAREAAADAEAWIARRNSYVSVTTGGPGTSLNRIKSVEHKGNLLTSLLHPGPAMPAKPPIDLLRKSTDIRRRSTEPLSYDIASPRPMSRKAETIFKNHSHFREEK